MAQPVRSLFIELRGMVGRLQGDMDSVVKTMTGAEKRITGVVTNIQKVMQAALVIGGVVAVKKLADAIGDLAKKGEEAGSIAEGFQKLGGSLSSITAARQATIGLVDSFELMQIANKGLVRGIPDLNKNFAMMADLGGRLANTLGTDTKGAIDQVVEAFAKGKPKQLEALGFVIDTDQAYRKFAETIGVSAKALTDIQKKEAIQIQALSQLEEVTNRLAPVTDSVANAQEAFSKTLGEGIKQIGIAVNSSDNLRGAWRRLEEVVSTIDWDRIGRDIAAVASIVLDVASNALPRLVEEFHNLANGAQVVSVAMDLYASGVSRSLSDALDQAVNVVAKGNLSKAFTAELTKIQTTTNQINDALSSAVSLKDLERLAPQVQKLSEFLDSKGAENPDSALARNIRAVTERFNILATQLPATTTLVVQHGEKGSRALEEEAKAAAKLAEEIKKIQDAWKETSSDVDGQVLGKELEAAISSLDRGAFEALKQKLADSIKAAFIEANRAAFEKGGIPKAEVEARANAIAEIETSAWAAKFTEKSEEAYQNSIDTWRGLFENAITGVTFDLESALKQVAVGFAAQLAQAVAGNIGGINISSPADLGGAIFNSIFGQGGSGGGGLGGLLNGAVGGAGLLGLAGEGTFLGGVSAGLSGTAIAPSTAAMSSGLSVGATAASAMPYVAAAVAAYYAANEFGLFGGKGPTNPETLARKSVEKYLEEAFEKFSNSKFFNSSGQLENFDGNFVFGNIDRFRDGSWAEKFKDMGDDAVKVFGALGQALEETLGLTEDVGDQIGFILAENLGANIDNARLLVMKLGLSLEDLTEKMVQAGMSGEMTWHQVEVALQGLTQAFEPGLVAVGDLKGAWDAMIASGGRGLEALKGIKDIAVEAMEAGATSLGDLGNRLATQGVDPAQIQALMNALSQRGITTLQQMASASDRVTGGIVADLESGSKAIQELWAQMNDEVKKNVDLIKEIPEKVETSITLNWKSKLDQNTEKIVEAGLSGAANIEIPSATKFAKGGVVGSSTLFGFNGGLGLMGEAGPEAIVPLTRLSGGRLGVSVEGMGDGAGSMIQLNIDARYAAPGVENQIRRVIREMTPFIQQQAVNAVSDRRLRGGSFARVFE